MTEYSANSIAAGIVDELGSHAWFVVPNEYGYVADVYSADSDAHFTVRIQGGRASLPDTQRVELAGVFDRKPDTTYYDIPANPRATVALTRGARAMAQAVRSRILTDAYREGLAYVARRNAERGEYVARRDALAEQLAAANPSASIDDREAETGRDVMLRWSPAGRGYGRARIYADSVHFDELSVTAAQAVAIMSLLAE